MSFFNNNILKIPDWIVELPSLLAFNFVGNYLDNLPPYIKGNLNLAAVKTYFRELKQWTPDKLIEKIRKNRALNNFDKQHLELGRFVNYIMEAIQDVENEAKHQFLTLLEERFSINLEDSPYKIYL